MSDGLHLDSILTGKEVSMSIAEKMKAKKERDSSVSVIEEIPTAIPEEFKSNFSEPELIVSQAMSYYYSLGRDKQSEVNHFIASLEAGKILTQDSTFIDEALASIILTRVISESKSKYIYPNETVRMTSDAFAPDDIKIENDELHLADAYEQKVHDAIDKYADELLADSILMFAEAMNFDPRFCDVIVRGDTQFFREVEDMGFPTLALMVKGIMSNRTEPI